MLDVCLLGTGGMMPLPYRWLTSLMMRYNGQSILIDCGEGTQIAMRKKGWSPNPIGIICFTHFHADHISGLPGLLLSMGNAERNEPLILIGPKGLTRIVNSLRTIAPELPFDIEYREIEGDEQTFAFDGFELQAFRVKHNIPCYGYTMTVKRGGKFDPQKAQELNIPLKGWSILQSGEDYTAEGVNFTPDMVLGPERKGLKVTYCTDSRPVDIIAKKAEDADLFICEGMYGEPGSEERAKEHKHMNFYEAAKLAQAAQPKEMWLTHFSPAMQKPKEFEAEVQKVFPRAFVAKDGWSKDLNFED